jgi:hypothetical protein
MLARRLHRVHELPDQVRRIELQPHMGAVPECLEQRLPTHRPRGDVGSPGVRLPQHADIVLLAQRKIFFRVDPHDFVHLRVQRLSLDGAGLPADVRYPQLAAQLDALGSVFVLPGAPGRIRVDVVSIHRQRRNVDPRPLDLVFHGRNRGIVQPVGIQPQLHAGEAFLLHELQVGIGIFA